ncbi:hypothetical protein GQ457_07G041790 [Hibiscus cannabinus]
MSSSPDTGTASTPTALIAVVGIVVFLIKVFVLVYCCRRGLEKQSNNNAYVALGLSSVIGQSAVRNLRQKNGSLDRFLFGEDKKLGFQQLQDIAVGTAKGIAYLHEECQQRIIHYDIKPGNILLDANFFPKVADFGLAKLCNRDNTHVTMTGGRGTPGYAAPELWMPYPITHKCDVYSFGMLLFEIIGKRRNLDRNLAESQEWFPVWVWKVVAELRTVCGVEEDHRDAGERMVKTALWCIQYRPSMSVVVKMLEGGMEIAAPPNPFAAFLVETNKYVPSQSDTTCASDSIAATPIMKKYEIEMASTL